LHKTPGVLPGVFRRITRTKVKRTPGRRGNLFISTTTRAAALSLMEIVLARLAAMRKSARGRGMLETTRIVPDDMGTCF
jgi:hypothetical protein